MSDRYLGGDKAYVGDVVSGRHFVRGMVIGIEEAATAYGLLDMALVKLRDESTTECPVSTLKLVSR